MADAITMQALQDASLDAKSLEEVVNGNDTKHITTRLGESYPSVKKAIKTLFENGGLPAERFKTLSDLQASDLPDDTYALVSDDTNDNNGIYIKEGGQWAKSKYDVTATLSKTIELQAAENSLGKNLFNKNKTRNAYFNTTQEYLQETTNTIVEISEFIPVVKGGTYTISGFDKLRLIFMTEKLDRNSAVVVGRTDEVSNPYTFTVPDGARYVVIEFKSASLKNNPDVIQLEKGDAATKYMAYGKISADIIDDTELNDRIMKQSERPYESYIQRKNLLDPNAVQKDTYFNVSQKILMSGTGWAVSDFIPAKKGTTYTISGNRTIDWYAVFADKSGNNAVESGQSNTVTPTIDGYLVVSLTTNTSGGYSNVQVEQGDTATEFEPYIVRDVTIKADYILGLDAPKNKVVINSNEASIVSERVKVGVRFTDALSFDKSTVFNFTSAEINGSAFTGMSDDVAPYYIDDAPAIGANHGYFKATVTAEGHGKTQADTGSVWRMSSNNASYVLINVVDDNTLMFIPEGGGTLNMLSSLSHVSGATNKGDITPSNPLSSQMYPAFKNRTINLLIDDEHVTLADGEYHYKDKAVFAESYEIYTKSDFLTWAKANKGFGITDIDAESTMRVSITYAFDKDAGCSITHNIAFLKPTTLKALFFLQNILPLNGTSTCYVPKSKPFDVQGITYDFTQPVDIKAKNTERNDIKFGIDALADENKPIDRAIISNEYGYLATGFVQFADAEPQARLNHINDDFWRIKGSSLKTYAQAVNNVGYEPVSAGTNYTIVGYKKWSPNHDDVTAVYPVRSPVGNYLYIDIHSSGIKNIKLPSDYVNSAFEIVEQSENIDVLTKVAQGSITVNKTGLEHGYVVLRFNCC